MGCRLCGVAHPARLSCPLTRLLDSQTVLQAGTVLAGRFVIQAVVHRSSMSTIYRAHDRTQSHAAYREVAVKQVWAGDSSTADGAEPAAWLAREAGLLSVLQHPGLPRLRAAFSEGNHHYVVMPYLAGVTLQDYVRAQGPIREQVVFAYAEKLLAILGYLHGQKPPIVHRDLKPANILIHESGRIILLDFGVARAACSAPVGTAIGTPGYAAPEQYQGIADIKSDLYGLRATLYYMLTGYDAEQEPPFRHPSLHQYRPRVRRAMAHFVDDLLRLDPAARPDAATIDHHIRALRQAYWLTPLRAACADLSRGPVAGLLLAAVPVLPVALAPSVPNGLATCFPVTQITVPAPPAGQVSAALFIAMIVVVVASLVHGAKGRGVMLLVLLPLTGLVVQLYCNPATCWS